MVDAHLNGVRNAIAAGWKAPGARGGNRTGRAVEEAVVILKTMRRLMPAAAVFGNRDGKVQMDALIMDVLTLRAGGVGCVQRIANPIRAARKLLSESPRDFVAEGRNDSLPNMASLCARTKIDHCAGKSSGWQKYQARPEHQKADLFAPTISHDTVGAVASYRDGNIAAATSTGGTLDKAPGRLGDSSLIGWRSLRHKQSAAASTTQVRAHHEISVGEWAADRCAAGNMPEWVAAEAVNYLESRLNGHGGMILLNSGGHFGIFHNTPRMAWAVKMAKQESSGIRANGKSLSKRLAAERAAPPASTLQLNCTPTLTKPIPLNNLA